MKKILLLLIATWIIAGEVTLYRDYAFVKEIRQIQDHIISPLPKTIDPQSLYIQNLKGYYRFIPGGFNRSKLLQTLLHKEVEFEYDKKLKKGRVISIDPLIIQGDRVYFDVSFTNLRIPKLAIQTLPSLYLQSPSNGNTELMYLMRGISYSTIYSATLAKSLHIQGYIRIQNSSGYEPKDVKLSFVAGDMRRPLRYRTKTIQIAAAPLAETKEVQGVYKFTLPKRWDLQDGIFIPFVRIEVPYTIEYRADFYNLGLNSRKQKFRQILHFTPPKPLPGGQMSIYKDNLFLSTIKLLHSAPNMQQSLRLFNDFDLEVERITKEYKSSEKRFFAKMHYIVRNPKKERVQVRIYEHLPWSNMQIQSNQNFHQVDATTIYFTVEIPPKKQIAFDVSYLYRKK